jgi:regulator of cell morphogenesis and NO signaling
MDTLVENTLDVTLLEPRQKHPTIFLRFDELIAGESLTIHNDHDPKPLYYQLLGERGPIFTWEYLEEGPEWWKVKISKKLTGDSVETLGQIAAKDLHKAQIFKKYGLDFCCGGKKTVKQACAEKGLDVTRIEQELLLADKNPVLPALRYNDWDEAFLADFIVHTHHAYVKKTLPELKGYATKVARVHGSRHPELLPIRQLVEEIETEMTTHMMKEEQILFPYIKNLVAARNNSTPLVKPGFGTVQNPISVMEQEHEVVGDNLKEIRILTNQYQLPQDACASYSLLYRLMEEFEDDLHTHVHLENNILFPKALELEIISLPGRN